MEHVYLGTFFLKIFHSSSLFLLLFHFMYFMAFAFFVEWQRQRIFWCHTSALLTKMCRFSIFFFIGDCSLWFPSLNFYCHYFQDENSFKVTNFWIRAIFQNLSSFSWFSLNLNFLYWFCGLFFILCLFS